MTNIKHRKARRLLGSYQLRVAFAVMFTDRFRCPCCNEHTALDVKETLIDSRPRGPQISDFSRYQ